MSQRITDEHGNTFIGDSWLLPSSRNVTNCVFRNTGPVEATNVHNSKFSGSLRGSYLNNCSNVTIGQFHHTHDVESENESSSDSESEDVFPSDNELENESSSDSESESDESSSDSESESEVEDLNEALTTCYIDGSKNIFYQDRTTQGVLVRDAGTTTLVAPGGMSIKNIRQ